MLGLQIDAPLDRELERLARLLERCVDRLGVGQRSNVASTNAVEPRRCTPCRRACSKNSMSSARSSSTRAEDVLEELLGQVGVVGEVGERDLGLDHPELGEVARRVGVLGAERRAEGVDLAQRQAVDLDLELAGDGEVASLAEEVLGEVDLAVLGRAAGWRRSSVVTRNICAGALASLRGDDRRVDPEEAMLLEELVDRLRRGSCARGRRRRRCWCAAAGARPRAGTPSCGPSSASDSVGVVDPADDLDRSRPHLDRLPLALRRDDLAARRATRAAGR